MNMLLPYWSNKIDKHTTIGTHGDPSGLPLLLSVASSTTTWTIDYCYIGSSYYLYHYIVRTCVLMFLLCCDHETHPFKPLFLGDYNYLSLQKLTYCHAYQLNKMLIKELLF